MTGQRVRQKSLMISLAITAQYTSVTDEQTHDDTQ